MTRSRFLAAALGLVLVACGADPPTQSAEPVPSQGTPGDVTPTATPAPTSTPTAALPDPGQPFQPSEILDAMRDSRRPGGVPAELRTESIAAQLAGLLWTFDGEPWDAIAAGGSCGPSTCTLELSGSRSGAAGEDVWVFSIDPSTSAVDLVTADLHAVPADVAAELDRVARALDSDGALDGLLFTAVRWLPPPAEHRFGLAYRSGDEEEACAVDLVLDAVAPEITELTPAGC